MTQHRKPPLPAWYHDPGKGNCRWCGKPIGNNRRKWHPECFGEFRFFFWPKVTRITIWERSTGFCAGCGELLADRCRITSAETGDGFPIRRHREKKAPVLSVVFHLDHTIPLIDYPHDPQDPYAAWREGNLQILCEACHKAKTAREAAERARAKRKANMPLMEVCK